MIIICEFCLHNLSKFFFTKYTFPSYIISVAFVVYYLVFRHSSISTPTLSFSLVPSSSHSSWFLFPLLSVSFSLLLISSLSLSLLVFSIAASLCSVPALTSLAFRLPVLPTIFVFSLSYIVFSIVAIIPPCFSHDHSLLTFPCHVFSPNDHFFFFFCYFQPVLITALFPHHCHLVPSFRILIVRTLTFHAILVLSLFPSDSFFSASFHALKSSLKSFISFAFYLNTSTISVTPSRTHSNSTVLFHSVSHPTLYYPNCFVVPTLLFIPHGAPLVYPIKRSIISFSFFFSCSTRREPQFRLHANTCRTPLHTFCFFSLLLLETTAWRYTQAVDSWPGLHYVHQTEVRFRADTIEFNRSTSLRFRFAVFHGSCLLAIGE